MMQNDANDAVTNIINLDKAETFMYIAYRETFLLLISKILKMDEGVTICPTRRIR